MAEDEERAAAAAADMHSPSHIAMTGHDFSPEDIQAFLGGVLADDGATVAASNPGYLRPAHPPADTSDPAAGLARNNSSAVKAEININNTDNASNSSGPGDGSSNNFTEVSPAARAQARTERKRKLEKQRRSDVNKQFSELSTVLRQIESEAPEIVAGLTAYSPANRVDLIARTVSLLQNMHAANKKAKVEVADLQEQLENAKKAGEEAAAKLKESIMAPQAMGNNKVMMMVPMLIGGDNNSSASGGSSSSTVGGPAAAPPAPHPGTAMPMMQPWMPTPGAAGGAAQAMPWMMPAPPHAAAMPWMMPTSHHHAAASMMHPPVPFSEAKDPEGAGSSSSSAASAKKPLGGNLAHCA